MRAATLAAVLLATALVPALGSAQESPSIRIVSPAEGATHGGSTLEVRADVSGFRLVDPALAAGDAPDAGYIVWRVDGEEAAAPWDDGHETDDETFVVTGLRPGAHEIRAELVRGDGESLDPPVFATRNVTIGPDAPYLAFRSVEERDDAWFAEVGVERKPLAILDPVEIRWWMDGVPVATTNETWHAFVKTPGTHVLRAELVQGGEPLSPRVWDERVVGYPSLEWVDEPDDAMAPALDEPATVNLSVDLDGANLTTHALRVHVDGAVAEEGLTEDAFTVDLPVGEHVVAVELVDADGRALRPVVGLAKVVRIEPPPPEIEFNKPSEMATVPPSFFATVNVSNYTLGEGEGRIRWLVDGIEVAVGTSESQRIEGLDRGIHELRAELLDADGNAVADPAVRRVNVEPTPPPNGEPEEATGGDDMPAAGLVGLIIAVSVGLAIRRRLR